MNKLSVSLLFILFAETAMANTVEPMKVDMPTILLSIMAVLVFVLILLVYTLQKVVYVLKQEAAGGIYPLADERTTWEKLLSLKPLAAEKEVELDHDFDGIKELNNPIPFWFNVLFYSTIIFGFIYIMVFHVFDAGKLQAKEYEAELADAEAAKAAYVKKAGNLIDENNVMALSSADQFKDGIELYNSKCAVCHGNAGEGKVGPNLTDNYWLHGGDVKAIFKTIKYGVPSKGMIAWQNSLNGLQIQQLASYILSMQGTNPPGAKEPQGIELNTTVSSLPDSNATK
ncbi:MAG: c-type cytochrome [Bacteroidia bacterium]|nr:c-type cytochrome [Bacteroidia bacterium]